MCMIISYLRAYLAVFASTDRCSQGAHESGKIIINLFHTLSLRAHSRTRQWTQRINTIKTYIYISYYTVCVCVSEHTCDGEFLYVGVVFSGMVATAFEYSWIFVVVSPPPFPWRIFHPLSSALLRQQFLHIISNDFVAIALLPRWYNIVFKRFCDFTFYKLYENFRIKMVNFFSKPVDAREFIYRCDVIHQIYHINLCTE